MCNNLSDSRATLQQALRTLRGIRERYEEERTAHPDVRCYSMRVALGDSDMFWIAATIEALEKPTVVIARVECASCGRIENAAQDFELCPMTWRPT